MITHGDLVEKLSKVSGYKPQDDGNRVALIFRTQNYVDPSTGQNLVLVVLKLEENGEYLKIFVPAAWKIKGRNVDEFLKACMMIQWRTKLIQFEYDESDGEIRPMIEWPIEDGTVTTRQLERAIAGLQMLVDKYAPVLDTAIAAGKIDFDKAS